MLVTYLLQFMFAVIGVQLFKVMADDDTKLISSKMERDKLFPLIPLTNSLIFLTLELDRIFGLSPLIELKPNEIITCFQWRLHWNPFNPLKHAYLFGFTH